MLMENRYREWFQIQLSKARNTNVFTLHVWEHMGQQSIGNVSFEVDGGGHANQNTFSGIKSRMDSWSEGFVRCSGCGEKIERDKIAGRYFAGVYCQNCWDTKYKAIEAKETYN
jgi:formamidopyrimidine-DNA glycosylase